MKKTFCDGCRVELTTTNKRLDIEHTFATGVNIKGTFTFASDARGAEQPSGEKQMISGDGDFCEECLRTVIQEGWVV